MFGGIMMSRYHTTEITCPVCNKTYKIDIWDSINAQLNPEKKKDILKNDIYKTICPSCKAETHFIYDFLYHDMEKKYMISLLDDYPMELINPLVESGYSLRKVDDINQLIEKIRIFDAGLNDIALEVMKKILSEIMNINDNMLFCQVEKDDFIFLVLKEGKAISVPSAIYDLALKDCTKEDLKEYPRFMGVNQSYIEQLIK